MSNGFQKNVFQVVKEGQEDILKVDCRAAGISPILEDDAVTMMLIIEKLVEFPNVKRINFYLNKNYSYNYHQTQLLVEIANVYNALVRQRKIWGLVLDQGHASYLGERLKNLQNLVYGLIKSDPIGAFVEIKRLRRESRIKLKNGENNYEKDYYDFTDQVYNLIKNTGLINQVREELEGYELGDRGVYKIVFRPSITPDFMFSRLQAQPPMDAEQVDFYTVGDADIGVYKIPEEIKFLYQLNPPEFKLTEEEYALLDVARGVIREHQPNEEDFLEPERVRMTFFNISKDLVTELADQKGMDLSLEKLNVLSEILVRYTVGFGLIEVLLDDEKIQDITINSPAGESPIFIVHQDYGHCFTNITSSSEDVQGWATKFRILSGRALDEANPILDTELILPRSRARVAIITAPLNPYGIGYAFRRHRDKPWTLPLFIKNKMMNSMAAGLLSFIIDGNRTLLFCGTRSSGKTSVLGAIITEIMRRCRILSVEDTLELPMEAFRKLGYNVQPMKVRSALASGGTELSADEGIRTSLRMGDSALIIGEVRSQEAKSLYESMRIGALANVVAGTIHGESPYGVFDRVVNDLGVPKTSFKATDLIVLSNPVRSPDGLSYVRRILQITEVRKHWQDDPLKEGGFMDLMKYNPKTDQLEITDDLRNGDSELLKAIASNVKDWAGNWEAVWDNILLRAKIKQALVDYSVNVGKPELLEADFVVRANDMFHIILETVKNETGSLDSERIYNEWISWLEKNAGKLNK